MKRLYVLVEGQTEERFINDLLAAHLAPREFSVSATRIATKVIRNQRAHRGGHGGNYEFIQRDVQRLLHSNPDAVTTMLDYYRLPQNFPGLNALPAGDCFARAQALEAAFTADIRDRRFIPNLIIHEFEALLFSKIESIQTVFPDQPRLPELQRIVTSVASPEEINDLPKTAPAQRLLDLFPSYDKVSNGLLIAERVGIQAMREKCRHFAAWLARLEQL